MTLLYCLCGFAAALGIGRYNQSNKLFWALFTSFVLGIAGGAVYNKMQQTQSKVRTTQVCPTQESSVSNTISVTLNADLAVCTNLPAPVGKDFIPEYNPNVLVEQWVKLPIIPPPRMSA